FNWIFPGEFARCMAAGGLAQQGLDIFNRAKIDLAVNSWYAPELPRIRGELALSNNEGIAVCRQYFLSALELSAEQGSLSWALRAATSLAIAEKPMTRRAAAHNTLHATYAKFREGLDTLDLKLATRVLNGSYWRDGLTGAAR